MRTETSGNSSFPSAYHILQFEKGQNYRMYPVLMWTPGERVRGGLIKGCVCVLSWQKGEHVIKNATFPILKRKYFVRMRHAVC